jgi:hypothetical protein
MVQNENMGVYQTNFDEIENIRKMLSINYERSNQLNALNFQMVAISTAIILGVISLFGSSYFTSNDPLKNWEVIFIINVVCLALLSWRYTTHIIENKIIRCYQKIVQCEYKLNIPLEISLLHDLEIETEYTLNTDEISRELNRHMEYASQNYLNKTRIVQKLIDKNKFGYYASDFFDKMVSLIVIVLFGLEYWFAFEVAELFTISFKLITDGVFCMAFFFLPLIYGTFIWGLIWEIPNGFPIQRMPTEGDIKTISQSLSETTQ